MRLFLLTVSAIQILFAAGLFYQVPQITSLWPFPGTTPLTFIFIASILAAAAASQLWVVRTGQFGALAGIALDYILILTPVAVYMWQIGASTGNTAMFTYATLCAAGAVLGVVLFWWSRRLPLDTSIALPAPVRWSFLLFIVALLLVSVQLIRQVPNVIPWTITPELSVVIGWMFLGAMTYFIYGLLRPSWSNAGSQLAGFLAYDLVLLVPFLTRLPAVAPEFRLGLWIYTAVVSYSAILAVYYLFINPSTRLLKSQPVPALSQ